jgi:hypothetical protein
MHIERKKHNSACGINPGRDDKRVLPVARSWISSTETEKGTSEVRILSAVVRVACYLLCCDLLGCLLFVLLGCMFVLLGSLLFVLRLPVACHACIDCLLFVSLGCCCLRCLLFVVLGWLGSVAWLAAWLFLVAWTRNNGA